VLPENDGRAGSAAEWCDRIEHLQSLGFKAPTSEAVQVLLICNI
jgi:hypothetical protein